MTGSSERGEALVIQPMQAEHDCLSKASQFLTLRLAPMHVTNWAEVQDEDVLVAACWKWMCTRKEASSQKRDVLLRRFMGDHSDSEEGKALFCIMNSLTMKKGMLYVNTTPKAGTEGLWAFVVLSAHRCTALNSVHRDA